MHHHIRRGSSKQELALIPGATGDRAAVGDGVRLSAVWQVYFSTQPASKEAVAACFSK